jgi:hypothetical protein
MRGRVGDLRRSHLGVAVPQVRAMSAASDDIAPARRRNSHPEHSLQVLVNKFTRAHVVHPHFFTSVDRAAQRSKFDHMRQKAAGQISGVPDCLLVVPGFALICVELKAPGKRPTSRQFEVGEALRKAGATWAWCDSVEGYATILRSLDVPLTGRWDIAAQAHDATLAGAAIRREETRTGRVSKARRAYQPKPGPRYQWPAGRGA